VFLPTIETAEMAAMLFRKAGVTCGTVSSLSDDRDEQLIAWKGGEIRAMTNVGILGTGFNFPALDAIISLRPTQSAGLWQQQLGRGMRVAVGKQNCLVLDYVGNLQRLGGVGAMDEWDKEGAGGATERRTEGDRKGGGVGGAKRVVGGGNLALLTLDPMLTSATGLLLDVKRVRYATRPGKRPGKNMMMAMYDCETEQGVSMPVTEFVCVEYDGGARWHAESWFKRRGHAFTPFTARTAMVEAYGLPTPRQLRVRKNGSYINVLKEVW
jgi:DNA repair protein RadD